MMTSTFTDKPSSKHESYFYSTTTCIKDLMVYVYLQIGPDSYLRVHFLYNNINLTLNIIVLLCFKATFQSTHLALKDLYYLEITNIPLTLCTTHNKHVYFTLELRGYILYYLDVTAFPPRKESRLEIRKRKKIGRLDLGIG
jgi:hypothetical protein